MPTSSRLLPRADTFRSQALGLAWGAWTELGVSGWTTTHTDWAIDPEPLIVLTAYLGDSDARLRDEATDWCIRNWRFVSKARLRNVARSGHEALGGPYGEFAATVNEHAGAKWPDATVARRYRPTRRSVLPPLDRPSMAWLRLRAIFGLGARTEVIRYFLAHSEFETVARVAAACGYTKRNVAAECEALRQAGVLRARTVGNRFYFALARRSGLEEFVGEIADVRPNWLAMLNVTTVLVELEGELDGAASRVAPVKIRKALTRIAPDLSDLDVDNPSADLRGEELVPALRVLGRQTLGNWSAGNWAPDSRTVVASPTTAPH